MSWAEAMSDGFADEVVAEIRTAHRNADGMRELSTVYFYRGYRCCACGCCAAACEHFASAFACDECGEAKHTIGNKQIGDNNHWACVDCRAALEAAE